MSISTNTRLMPVDRGEIHIVEPDLASVVKTAVEGGFLQRARRQLKRMPGYCCCYAF
ncbi:hypothetical protein ACLK10_21095 [Escherichia coli]